MRKRQPELGLQCYQENSTMKPVLWIRLLSFAALLRPSLCNDLSQNKKEKRAASGTGPVFIVEPVSKIDFLDRSVINCLVHGDPDPKVTWYRKQGESFKQKLVSNDGFIRILPNNSLMLEKSQDIPGLRQAFHPPESLVYRCEAVNRYGTIVSKPVHINIVAEAQEYSTQVYDEYVVKSNTALMTCHLPSYISDYVLVSSWIKNDRQRILPGKYDQSDKFFIDNDGKLYMMSVDENDSNSVFKCETKHRLTGRTVITNQQAAGRLHVTSPTNSIPPNIIHSKQEVKIFAGNSIILPCVAHAYPPPIYRWCHHKLDESQCQDIKASDRYQVIGGSLQMIAKKEDSGTYICKVSNAMGQVQIATKVAVFSPITAFIHPQTQIIDIYQSVRVECVVTGGPVKLIRWLKDGRQIFEESLSTGQSSSVLSIERANSSSPGMYQCFAENSVETKQASGQLILSASPPRLMEKFKKKIIQPGSSVTLECAATGDPVPKVIWSFNDDPILSQEDKYNIDDELESVGVIRSRLSVLSVGTPDGGIYSCTAQNKVGSSTHSSRLDVYGVPTVKPLKNATVISGQQVSLNCFYSGYPIQRIIWHKNNEELTQNSKIVLHGNGTLTIRHATRSHDQGTYQCQVINKHGLSSTGIATVIIIDKPRLGKFKAEKIVEKGLRLQIYCALEAGDPPIEYFWFLNGKEIPHRLKTVEADSAFSSTLISAEVSYDHSGNYSCVAKNKAGSAIESTIVKVRGSPEWKQRPPKNKKIHFQESVELPCAGIGFPIPTAHWYRRSDEGTIEIKQMNTDRTVSVSEDGVLRVAALRTEDSKFICEVKNGLKPDLVQEVEISLKVDTIAFQVLQNNIQANAGKSAVLECAAKGIGPFIVSWTKGLQSKLSSKRMEISNVETPYLIKSTLQIHQSRPEDSGFYTCEVNTQNVNNSTKLYLSILGNKNGELGDNWTPEDDIQATKILPIDQYSWENENVSQSATNLKISGLTLLYIIPTITAAVVLLVILIIFCTLLHSQRRRTMRNQNLTKAQNSVARSSIQIFQQKNDEEDGMSTLSSDRYFRMKLENGTLHNDEHLYSRMSTYPRAPSSHIQPYATFTSEKPRRFSETNAAPSLMETKEV